ncbi:MAG: rRNA maturation RNase YbeY [Actinomycetota bacterium]|nr:rRNA maturation RNase YbeY [Actinomycetota bacterium]
MNVFLANEQAISVDERRLSALARHVLVAEGVAAEIELSVLLVTREHIKQLNARFADNNYPTDVLAFPMMEDDEDETSLLGDVVICPQVAEENAGRLGHSLSRELDTLVVHGTLHLLGYDHQREDERARMDARIAQILDSFISTPV